MAEPVAVLNQDGKDLGARRSKEPTKYAWIDALRGFAILGVLAHHSFQYVRGMSGPAKFLGGFGKMGVQLFFVASAITLCLSTAKRAERHPVLSFYVRRYFRIAPLYYLAIIFYALYSVPFNAATYQFRLAEIEDGTGALVAHPIRVRLTGTVRLDSAARLPRLVTSTKKDQLGSEF